jgi:hypothetical protein
VPARAAVWPDQLGNWIKTESKPVAFTDRSLWDEYGLQQSEQAGYAAGAKRFQATAYRFKDPTGAFGAFEWQRPANARPSKLGELAATAADGVLLLYHNYLLQFVGWKPELADIQWFLDQLRDVDRGPLPTLKDHLPATNLIANSERYVLGPAGLDRFEPRIPPSVAAFHLGTEAQLGSFRTKSGLFGLSIFSYPNPQIARQRLPEFEKLPGAMAKRAGPLVAVILSPSDPDAAERVLSEVRYEATFTWTERVPTARDNVGNLIVNIFILIGFLMALFLVVGLAFGFLRRWIGWGRSEEPMILLHLEDRR